MARKKPKTKRYISNTLTIIILVGVIIVYIGYHQLFSPNIHTPKPKDINYLYIPSGASFEQVENLLVQSKYLINSKSFHWMAVKMNYPNHVKPGKYMIQDGMTNRELIHMLRAGRQVPVRLVINHIRFKKELAAQVSRQIEADSVSIIHLLTDDVKLSNHGFNIHTIMVSFIPNTYEFYWNTSAEEFLERMIKEYKKFWSDVRIEKSKTAGLSPIEVSVMASIIEEETQKNSDKPIIAGVYINRLNKGMLLQADPTVRYAYGDFSIKRILNKYKEIDSKYNTYKYKGLPPGPICIPSISSLEAVLNYQKSDYLYFCAKNDFSGYHVFERTLEQHNRDAQLYQNVLNRSGILR